MVDTMDKWLRAPDVFSDIVTYEENVGEIGEVDERILDAIEASHEEIENDVRRLRRRRVKESDGHTGGCERKNVQGTSGRRSPRWTLTR